MSVTGDIFRSYRYPRAVIANKLAQGAREDRAIATLLGACLLMFISNLPSLARQAHMEETSLLRLLSYSVYGLFFFFPLIAYMLAAVTRILALPLRPTGGWYAARLALFWALFATTPLMLLNGLVSGFVENQSARNTVGLLWLVGFLWLWVPMFLQSQWGKPPS